MGIFAFRVFVQTVWLRGLRSVCSLSSTSSIRPILSPVATRFVSDGSGRLTLVKRFALYRPGPCPLSLREGRYAGVSAVHYRSGGVGQDTANDYSAISPRILDRLKRKFYQNSQENAGYTKDYNTKDELIALWTELRYNGRGEPLHP